MRINHNLMAMNTHRQYGVNNSNVSKNVEKLSSGFRINRAGDDAAGLAISEKMRAQIRGLSMASRNSQDAISLVQTAEGALQSTHDILQRMRELAVQSASDTNETTIDRDALNKEFQAMLQEIDDTATKTTFNDLGMIDGTFAKYKVNTEADGTSTYSPLNSINGKVYASSLANAAATADNALVSPINMTLDVVAPGADYTVTTGGTPASTTITGGPAPLPTGISSIDTSGYTGNGDFSLAVAVSAGSLTINGETVANGLSEITLTNGVKITFASPINLAGLDESSFGATPGTPVVTPAPVSGVTFGSVNAADFPVTVTVGDSVAANWNGDGTQPTQLSGTTPAASASGASTFTGFILEFDFVEGSEGAFNSQTIDNFTYVYDAGTGNNEKITASIDIGGTTFNGEIQFDGSANQFSSFTGEIELQDGAGNKVTITLSATDYTKDTDVASAANATLADMAGNSSNTAAAIPANAAPGAGSNDTGTPASDGTLTIGGQTVNTADPSVTLTNGTVVTFTSPVDLSTIMDGDYGTSSGNASWTATTTTAGATTWNYTVTTTPAAGGTTQTLTNKAQNAIISYSYIAADGTTKQATTELFIGQTKIQLANGVAIDLGTPITGFTPLTPALFSGPAPGPTSGTISFDIEATGFDFTVQTGANKGDELKLNIDKMDAKTLGIFGCSVAVRTAASSAIDLVNSAVNRVSAQRADLGALQNRLEFKITNLDTSAENLQAAESRIRDLDMAKEMTSFTKNNILSQAATAMLAQANSLPQGVLQLLQ